MPKHGQAAFEALFRDEFDACVAAARRIVADGAVAEELAAEAFTRAWVRWRRVARLDRPGAWVLRVTTNLALDHLRRGHAPAAATLDRSSTAFEELTVEVAG